MDPMRTHRKRTRGADRHTRPDRWVLALLLGLAVAAAPSMDAQAKQKVVKPSTPAVKLPMRAWRELSASDRLLAEVGSEDEEGPFLFGTISSVTIGGDSTIYVAEASSGQIRAFSPKGAFLGAFGRRGRGPGEFAQPIGIFHDGDSTIFAWQGFFGITELTARRAKMAYRRSFSPARNVIGACHLAGRTLQSVGVEHGLVQVLDERREPIDSFGQPFSTVQTPYARRLSISHGAQMVCVPEFARLYLHAFGRVRSYRLDGSLDWEATLPDFRFAVYVDQGAAASMLFPEDGISGIQHLAKDLLLVYVTRVDYAAARRPPRTGSMQLAQPAVAATRAYLIDARSGRLLAQVSHAPTMHAFRHGIAVEIVQDPYPMLRVRAVQPRMR